jgi:hypothetical protein
LLTPRPSFLLAERTGVVGGYEDAVDVPFLETPPAIRPAHVRVDEIRDERRNRRR